MTTSPTTAANPPGSVPHDNAAHAPDAPAHLAHHFDTPQQQSETGKLGMWVFLATEILMFGGLFCGYAIYRGNHPDVFEYAHRFLNWKLGAINTVILLTSSMTMAWAVRAAAMGQRKLLTLLLTLTIGGGVGFLVVKYFEYSAKFASGLKPGAYNAYYDFKTANEMLGLKGDDAITAEQQRYHIYNLDNHYLGKYGIHFTVPPAYLKAQFGYHEHHGDVHTETHATAAHPDVTTANNHANTHAGKTATTHTETPDLIPLPSREGLGEGRSPNDSHHTTTATNTNQLTTEPSPSPSQKASGELVAAPQASTTLPASATTPEIAIHRSNIALPAQSPTGLHPAVLHNTALLKHSAFRPHPVVTFEQLPDPARARVHIFYQLYYMMTGLHVLHVVIGMGLLTWVLIKAARGVFNRGYFNPVDNVGLYWHLVDLIWIFLFPLLYLIH